MLLATQILIFENIAQVYQNGPIKLKIVDYIIALDGDQPRPYTGLTVVICASQINKQIEIDASRDVLAYYSWP